MTIDYDIFADKRLREVLNLGPKFRFEMAANFLEGEGKGFARHINDTLARWRTQMAQKFGIPKTALAEMVDGLASHVEELLADLDSPPIAPLQSYKSFGKN